MIYSGHGQATQDLIRPEDGRRERGVRRLGESGGQGTGEGADQGAAVGDRPQGRPRPVGEEVRPMTRAALYARKSTSQEKASEEARSVARQIALAREFADRQGWAVDAQHVYVDDGVSGGTFDPKKRPGLAGLLAAAKARQFEV